MLVNFCSLALQRPELPRVCLLKSPLAVEVVKEKGTIVAVQDWPEEGPSKKAKHTGPEPSLIPGQHFRESLVVAWDTVPMSFISEEICQLEILWPWMTRTTSSNNFIRPPSEAMLFEERVPLNILHLGHDCLFLLGKHLW
jgi:hypothetical protein